MASNTGKIKLLERAIELQRELIERQQRVMDTQSEQIKHLIRGDITIRKPDKYAYQREHKEYPNRLGLLKITYRQIEHMLNLPPDTSVLYVNQLHDNSRRAGIEVILNGPKMPETAELQPIPVVDITFNKLPNGNVVIEKVDLSEDQS
jgi:hypothetical protein